MSIPISYRYYFSLAWLFFLIISCSNNRSLKFENRLKNASSPYLREHADNPVDWYEWGEEAIHKATREGKPLLISIGYASCHWCHVMEEESFMDTAVARIMNTNFVCVKVDREERPDVDQTYIDAAQLINGNAGWPLTAFALPDGKPFYAATYFPKKQWLILLNRINEAYQQDLTTLTRQANEVSRGIVSANQFVVKNEEIKTLQQIQNSFHENLLSALDTINGGIRGEMKFPMPSVWEYLLSNYYHTDNQKNLIIAFNTLDQMARGGIFDHLAGGFARYSTDSLWRIPHFEKMLYDNGQLVSLYAHAYQINHSKTYADVVYKTLDFVSKELTSPEGAFYSSVNADSEGAEGAYYVWTFDQLKSLLTVEELKVVSEYYSIKAVGNWEHKKNVLIISTQQKSQPEVRDLTNDKMMQLIASANKKLYLARSKRERPSTDTKILVSWNAMMICGYVDAYWALGDERFLNAALKASQFIEAKLFDANGQLYRSYSYGKASIHAFLDDYAWLAKAYIKLYQATYNFEWLTKSEKLVNHVLMNFEADTSGLYQYSDMQTKTVIKKTEWLDDVIPSSNAVLADNLYWLASYFDKTDYSAKSDMMINAVKNSIPLNPVYATYWGSLIQRKIKGHTDLAIMGSDAVISGRNIMSNYLPDVILMGGNVENLPLLENKLIPAKTFIYVCRNKVCKQPTEDVDDAMLQLNVKKLY